MWNAFEILELSENAGLAEIRKNYRRLCLRAHPDRSRRGSNEQFRVLCEAYAILRDSDRRVNEGRLKKFSSRINSAENFSVRADLLLRHLEVLRQSL